MNTFEACMAYLLKLEPAISGSGGHNATIQAALACQRFGLTHAEIWDAMCWFNEHKCHPRWSEAELRHKVNDATEIKIQKPLGQPGTRRGVRGVRRQVRAFVAPAPVERLEDPRPIYQRSEQDEELFWARVAVSLGTTLEAFDQACGVSRSEEMSA